MNLQLQYRAFDLINREFIYFDMDDLLRGEVPLHPGSCDFVINRFTGLYDVDDNPIYEDDIVEDSHNYTGSINMWGVITCNPDLWHEDFINGDLSPKYAFQYKGFLELIARGRIYLIGNIHENIEVYESMKLLRG